MRAQGHDADLRSCRQTYPSFLTGLLLITASFGCGTAGRGLVRFGYGTAPPLMQRDEVGRPTGFFVEAIEEAGRRSGYRIEWSSPRIIRLNDEALRRREVDMLTGPITPERRREFYVTEPWWFAEMVAAIPRASPIARDEHLQGRVLAVPDPAVASVSRYYSNSRVLTVLTARDAAEMVCAGKAEAAVIPEMYLRELAFARSRVCQDFALLTINSQAAIEYALIARPEAARIARRLRTALDEVAADGTLASIATRYPPISAPYATQLVELPRLKLERRAWQIGLAAATVIAALCALFIVKQRASHLRLRRDLRARMRAEAALRDSEARFRALFDSAPQTVLALDRDGFIAFANQKAEEMFGYPRERIIQTKLEFLLPERLRADFRENRLAGRPDTYGLRADGKEFPIEINLGAVNTNEGLTLAFIADVSERAALYRQLLQAQKLESVGRLTGGVAHDFNNLLTVMRGYAQMALDDLGSREDLREPLNEIARAADRASALTRQLLMFSRQQTGVPRIISLNELLGNLERMLHRLIGEDIELILSLDRQVPSVNVDPVHIEQVVMNLALNSRDAMPEGGKLVIETALFHAGEDYAATRADLAPGDYVLLKVSDTGTGMSPEIQPHIFEPFFTTKPQGKGTGLGLSTVYGIVKQAQGTVLVYSEPGKGATFKILLPAAEAPQPEEVGRIEPLPKLTGGETILVAEDEPGVRKFVAEVLRSHGYSVLDAANGNAALEAAAAHPGRIDLLLTDLVMPEMGGADLARRFAQLYPGSPVLLMSGYSDRLLHPDFAASLIEKPCPPLTLLRRVREALDSAPAETPS